VLQGVYRVRVSLESQTRLQEPHGSWYIRKNMDANVKWHKNPVHFRSHCCSVTTALVYPSSSLIMCSFMCIDARIAGSFPQGRLRYKPGEANINISARGNETCITSSLLKGQMQGHVL
jgi:hypothetical protein